MEEYDNVNVRIARAELLAANGDGWHEMKNELAKAIELKPNDHYITYQSAVVSLAVSDQAAYSEICKRMLATFADPDSPLQAYFASWACALASNSVEDYAPAIRLARYAVDIDIDDQHFRTNLGAILMRAGVYTEAKDHLDLALKAPQTANTSLSYIRYFLAMTEHHLGHQQSAKELLEAANKSAEEELSESPAWNRRLTLERLRNEAEALIVDVSTPQKY